jgi:hypothetical protein
VTINIAALYLPPDVQDQINNLKVDLNKASDTISLKTTENYKRIRTVLHNVYVLMLSSFTCHFFNLRNRLRNSVDVPILRVDLNFPS